MAESIRDKVAIVGGGCTHFGERWDKSFEDLAIEAAYAAFEDAGIGPKDIEAAWIGTQLGSTAAGTLAAPLKLNVPVARVENASGTGHEAVRNASFSLMAKAYDLVLAVGCEKTKDSGFGGIGSGPGGAAVGVDAWHPTYIYGTASTAPARFALAATAYFAKYGLSVEEGKIVLAKISVKSHYYGARNPNAHLRREITVETALKAPMVAWPLGLYDCCGVSDGSAALVLCRTEDAKKFRDDYVTIKAMGACSGPGMGRIRTDYDWTWFEEDEIAVKQAYKDAGITDPHKEIDLVELHDCFSISELMTIESLLLCDMGKYKEQISDTNAYYLGGDLPTNISGGLKSFGHPTGASGVHETFENYREVQGKAVYPERQKKNWKTDRRICMSHNRGGAPGRAVTNVTIIGLPE
jgi:acetyl-CoA C-acetyltransferase